MKKFVFGLFVLVLFFAVSDGNLVFAQNIFDFQPPVYTYDGNGILTRADVQAEITQSGWSCPFSVYYYYTDSVGGYTLTGVVNQTIQDGSTLNITWITDDNWQMYEFFCQGSYLGTIKVENNNPQNNPTTVYVLSIHFGGANSHHSHINGETFVEVDPNVACNFGAGVVLRLVEGEENQLGNVFAVLPNGTGATFTAASASKQELEDASVDATAQQQNILVAGDASNALNTAGIFALSDGSFQVNVTIFDEGRTGELKTFECHMLRDGTSNMTDF